jgi:hypothetical protein
MAAIHNPAAVLFNFQIPSFALASYQGEGILHFSASSSAFSSAPRRLHLFYWNNEMPSHRAAAV